MKCAGHSSSCCSMMYIIGQFLRQLHMDIYVMFCNVLSLTCCFVFGMLETILHHHMLPKIHLSIHTYIHIIISPSGTRLRTHRLVWMPSNSTQRHGTDSNWGSFSDQTPQVSDGHLRGALRACTSHSRCGATPRMCPGITNKARSSTEEVWG